MTQPLSVGLDEARDLFAEALGVFVSVSEELSDHDLLAASRCRGWTVADLLAHVHLSLQEMLLWLVSTTEEEPDTDAASYWVGSVPATDDTADVIDQVRFAQRLSAAYRRPTGLVAHLRLTASGLQRVVAAAHAPGVEFQGHVLTTGDFLATWVVELAVHQLDLALELEVPPPPAAALALARRTVEALAGTPFPGSWDDSTAVLLGTGRVVPDAHQRGESGDLADLLPVLG